jgi:hypothetical protein
VAARNDVGLRKRSVAERQREEVAPGIGKFHA